MLGGDLRKQGEEGRGFHADWRNGHQAAPAAVRLADGRDQSSDVADRAAALLLLVADVHLDIDGGARLAFSDSLINASSRDCRSTE